MWVHAWWRMRAPAKVCKRACVWVHVRAHARERMLTHAFGCAFARIISQTLAHKLASTRKHTISGYEFLIHRSCHYANRLLTLASATTSVFRTQCSQPYDLVAASIILMANALRKSHSKWHLWKELILPAWLNGRLQKHVCLVFWTSCLTVPAYLCNEAYCMFDGY